MANNNYIQHPLGDQGQSINITVGTVYQTLVAPSAGTTNITLNLGHNQVSPLSNRQGHLWPYPRRTLTTRWHLCQAGRCPSQHPASLITSKRCHVLSIEHGMTAVYCHHKLIDSLLLKPNIVNPVVHNQNFNVVITV